MKKLYLIILLSFIAYSSSIFAQINPQQPEKEKHRLLSGNIFTGVSVPIKGINYWNKYWSPSYLGGASIFAYLTNDLLIGLRLNYNHWLADQDALAKDFPEAALIGEMKGEVHIIDIEPSVRYIIFDEYRKSNIFLQLGGGYINVKGNFKVDPVANLPVSYQYTKTGVSGGIGIKGGFIEILPLYNIIFSDQSPTHYLSINIGVTF